MRALSTAARLTATAVLRTARLASACRSAAWASSASCAPTARMAASPLSRSARERMAGMLASARAISDSESASAAVAWSSATW